MRGSGVRSLFVVLTLGACLVSLGGSCTSNTQEKREDAPPAKAAPAKTPVAPAAAEGLDEAEFSRRVPGIDPEGLDGKQRQALAEIANDVICDCGRPSTLAGCLKDQPSCEHGRRMAQLARGLVELGASALEGSDLIEQYYASFPEKRRRTFEFDAASCKGPATAPITLVEFADFECPFCGFAWPLFGEIVKELDGKARLCFLHFPLSQHEHAREAAQLVELAKTQGKFLELADLLFANQHALDRESLLGYAAEVGLDRAAARDALAKGTYDGAVEAQRQQGVAAGIEGTPSLFINGRGYSLPMQPDLILRSIDDELLWISSGGKWPVPAAGE